MRREDRDRNNDTNSPKKAGPYYNPHHKEDMAKLGITKDVLDTEEYFEKIGLPYEEKEEIKENDNNPGNIKDDDQNVQESGRPPLSKDQGPRKQRRVLPRSSEPTSATLWGNEAQQKISDIMTPIVCNHFGK